MTTGDTARSYKIISDCFNFAINNVGKDKDSGKLWQDYVEFIKSGPGMIGGTGWQDTQKMDALRAAYQKAICVPTSALFQLWREYDLFENGLSKINVSSPVFMLYGECSPLSEGSKISSRAISRLHDCKKWVHSIAKYDERP